MNTIIYFENEELPYSYNSSVLEKIRHLHPDEHITMISAGDFSAGGELLVPSCSERAEKYVSAGADAVLSLPAASILGGYGKKEFAGAALAQNLRVPNLLIIPCVPCPGQAVEECEKALRSYAMFMFRESSGYREKLTVHLNRMPLRDAQKQTVCDCIPEAAQLLSHPENLQALWLLDAMLQLYYITKTQFITAPEYTSCPVDPAYADHFEKRAAAETAEMLEGCSAEKLTDISGSTTKLVEIILERKDLIRNAASFTQIAGLLHPAPADRTRLFLLKAILGLRKIHMQICGLHTYVPYCYVCAKNTDKAGFLKQLEDAAWIPFIEEEAQKQAVRNEYRYLVEADKKAQDLIR